MLLTTVMLAAALLQAVLLPAVDSVDQVLGRKVLRGARVSVAVADAETGERLLSRQIDVPMIPASNLKLLTTATAVARLGADYHFVTRLLGERLPDGDGTLPGDLVLVGGGDPCLRADALAHQGVDDPVALLGGLLRERGVERVDGALVLDDGFLDREWVSPHWEAGDLGKTYGAPVSALSVHGNLLTVGVDGTGGGARPTVSILTVTEGYDLRNEVKWSGEPRTFVVGATRPDDAGVLRVSGRMSRGLSRRELQVPVRDGALLFGRCLLATLAREGVSVRKGLAREAGAARLRPRAVELARLESPLSLAVLLANKESDNSISDHLLKVVGAEVLEDGSFAGGARAVADFVSECSGRPAEGLAVTDGSGLGRTNRVTARQVTDVLVAMNATPGRERDLFLRSLPVAGLDGTLRERFVQPPYLGAVRAKSGYISGVSALSGYLQAASGRVLAFSILINDVPPTSSNRVMKDVQDDICRDLVDRW